MSPLLFLFLLPLFAGTEGKEVCLFRLILTDRWGDGWGRDSLSLTSNSQPLSLTPLSQKSQSSVTSATLHFGAAIGFFSFSAFDGDTVFVNFTSRSNYSHEDMWFITSLFNSQAPLILNGSGPGNKSQSFVASCPNNLTAVTDLKVERDPARPWFARLAWNGTAKQYRVARQTASDSTFVTFAGTKDKFVYIYLEPNSPVKFQVSSFSDFREGPGVVLEVNATSYPTCTSQLTLHLLAGDSKGWKEGHLDVYVNAKDLQNKTTVQYKVLDATSKAMKTEYKIATPLSPLDLRIKYHAPIGGNFAHTLEYFVSFNGSRTLLQSGSGNKKPADGSVTVTCPKKGQNEGQHLFSRAREVTGHINYTISGKQHLLAVVSSPCVNNNCPTGSCIPWGYCSGGTCVQYIYDDGTACPAPDQCSNGGVCNNGQCVASTLQPNGAPCDDSNSATVNDACNNGVCRGSTSTPSTPSPSPSTPTPWFPTPSTPSTPSPSTPSTPSGSSDTCTYVLQMFDSFGDGWRGEYINILDYLTGQPISSSSMYLSVPSMRNAQDVRFTVRSGLLVYVQFVPYAQDQSTLVDDSYQVVPDGGGAAIVISPPGLGVTDPTSVPQSTSFTASCSSTPSSPGTGTPGTTPGTGTPGTGTGTGSLCNPSPCNVNARCDVLGTFVRCTCNTGFSGNGQTCTQVTTPGNNCPTNCGSLNRQTCTTTVGVPTCGPCNSGFADSSGGTGSGNTQCSATSTCPSNCGNLNRQTCSFGSSTCGSCNSGFVDSNGGTSPGNSQCSATTPGNNCPTNCASLNRQTCTTTVGVPTCGPCNSGFVDSFGGTGSGNTQCSAASNCPNCANLNRQTCSSGSSTCGSCNSGFVDSNGGSSPGNTQCTQQQSGLCVWLPVPCANLNRQPCQASFGSPTCGPCFNGFSDSTGGSSTQNGNTQCNAASICSQAPDCSSRNRQPCQASFGSATCGPCLTGFNVNGGSGGPTGTSTCTSFCANINCGQLNRQACQASFNAATCGPCNNGFTVNGGNGAPTGTTQCTQTNTNTCQGAPTNCASLNRADCSASLGQPTCGACAAGYQGSASGTTACTAINYCANNNCDPNAFCTNQPAQQTYTCTCNTGFVGNGRTCSVSCSSLKVRRDWFDLTDTEKHTFVLAMNQLYTNGQYAPIVTQHTQVTNYAHGGAPFLYWHRAYLSSIEDRVRAFGGRFACFTMPYWDWTTTSLARLQELFSNTRNGAGEYIGIGTKDGNCFNGAHPFAGFSYNNACVRRAAPPPGPQNQGGFARPTDVANSMVTTSYGQWRQAIEPWHNYVHNWIGATMSEIPNSPADPSFWLHHTNVDHLWTIWQNCNNQQSLDLTRANNNPVWQQVWETANTRPTDNMQTWNIPAMSVLNLGNLNVNYRTSWVTTNVAAARCPASQRIWLQKHEVLPSMKSLFTNSIVSSSYTAKRAHLQAATGTGISFGGFTLPNNTFDPSAGFDFDGLDYDDDFGSGVGVMDTDNSIDPSVVTQLQQVYEVFKAAYIQTGNYRLSVQQALVTDCNLTPLRPDGRLIVSGVMLDMPEMQKTCAMGICGDSCWKLHYAARNISIYDPDTNSTLILPTLTPAPPLKISGNKLVPDVTGP